MSLEGALETHTLIAIDEMKKQMGDKWNQLPERHIKAATRAARRIVELEWKKRTTDANVAEDLDFVTTTVGEFKMAGEIALHSAFWSGVNKALEALGSFLVGAGKSLIPGLETLFAGIDLGRIISES